MDLERKRRFIINTAYYSIALALAVLVFRYAIFWLMPFVVGFLVAFILKPLINKLTQLSHMNRRPVAYVVVLCFYATAGVVIALTGLQLVFWIRNAVYEMPNWYEQVAEPWLTQAYREIMVLVTNWDPGVKETVMKLGTNLLEQLQTLVYSASSSLISMVSGVALSIPGTFISILFTIISSVFIAGDYYAITGFVVRQFSPKGQAVILASRDYLTGSVFKFITSYACIMSITFIEMAVGLTILSVPHSVLVAFLIALVDVLPVLGTGGVLIPWVIIELVGGDTHLGLGLLVLYLIVTVIRNILEPKIVGTRVGLHPVLMLMCMFVGVKLFGPLGLIIMPFSMIVLKNLNENGKINLFK